MGEIVSHLHENSEEVRIFLQGALRPLANRHGGHSSIPVVETETEERDPTETIRIALMVVGMALNLWLMWDYMKDRPEMLIARRRVETWWEHNISGPEARLRALRKAEAETVFEALTIVEGI